MHGPLTRYVKLQVAHAPGMPGTFSPAADFKENRLLAIPACITARAWRTCRDACRDRLHAVTGKTFPAFPAHAHPQFYVSGKRPMEQCAKTPYKLFSLHIRVRAIVSTTLDICQSSWNCVEYSCLCAYSTPSHDMDQCWYIINWTAWNKFQYNLNLKVFLVRENI